ncbi:meiotically up-regulated gene 113-domain-containing protein [Cladochytrium replicatum]|nr:meiotically up-regulated gene 113-domain-containing protein [Cladochytrium replicatum]
MSERCRGWNTSTGERCKRILNSPEKSYKHGLQSAPQPAVNGSVSKVHYSCFCHDHWNQLPRSKTAPAPNFPSNTRQNSSTFYIRSLSAGTSAIQSSAAVSRESSVPESVQSTSHSPRNEIVHGISISAGLNGDESPRRSYFDGWIDSTLSPHTQKLLQQLMISPISESDGPGYIYAYQLVTTGVDSISNSVRTGMYKIGRARNVFLRMAQWSKQCGFTPLLINFYPRITASSDPRIPELDTNPKPGMDRNSHQRNSRRSDERRRWCRFASRAERLIHIELSDRYSAGRVDCKCGKTHCEWFKLPTREEDSPSIDPASDGWHVFKAAIKKWVKFIDVRYGKCYKDESSPRHVGEPSDDDIRDSDDYDSSFVVDDADIIDRDVELIDSSVSATIGSLGSLYRLGHPSSISFSHARYQSPCYESEEGSEIPPILSGSGDNAQIPSVSRVATISGPVVPNQCSVFMSPAAPHESIEKLAVESGSRFDLEPYNSSNSRSFSPSQGVPELLVSDGEDDAQRRCSSSIVYGRGIESSTSVCLRMEANQSEDRKYTHYALQNTLPSLQSPVNLVASQDNQTSSEGRYGEQYSEPRVVYDIQNATVSFDPVLDVILGNWKEKQPVLLEPRSTAKCVRGGERGRTLFEKRFMAQMLVGDLNVFGA